MILPVVLTLRCVATGQARFAGAGRAASDAHPQSGAPRRAFSGQWRCLEGALRDAQRPEGALQDIRPCPKNALRGPGEAREARRAGEARRKHRIGNTDGMIIGRFRLRL
jgi:hypothetical protein